MNFYIINTSTNKVVSRSNIRPTDEPTPPKLRIDLLTAPEVVTSRHFRSAHLKTDEEAPVATKDEAPNTSTSLTKHRMHLLDPHDIVGRIFLFHKKMVNANDLE